MAESSKTAPPMAREPLPPIYPLGLIKVSVNLLSAMAALKASNLKCHADSAELLDEAGAIAIHIIRDGLASHELAAKEGRSRG